jgi:hypothetical protein
LIFIVSLTFTSWNHKRQLAATDFNNHVAAVEDQTNEIDAHLLYNDEAGAGKILVSAQAALASLPQTNKDQQAAYQRLSERLRVSAEKIQKIVRVTDAPRVNDLSNLGVTNLILANGKIYGGGSNFVYELTPNANTNVKTEIAGAQSLSRPIFDKNGNIYYWDNNRIAAFNIKTKVVTLSPINGLEATTTVSGFKIFNNNLYLLAANQNQIYRYLRANNAYGSRSNWLSAGTDLSRAHDLAIDGDIYILENSGAVKKFFKGAAQAYQAADILPAMTNASKISMGTNYIYIWEAASKRLAVLAKKDGHLMNQYQLDTLTDLKDFTIDEVAKTAYILAGDGVYKVVLNQ